MEHLRLQTLNGETWLLDTKARRVLLKLESGTFWFWYYTNCICKRSV